MGEGTEDPGQRRHLGGIARRGGHGIDKQIVIHGIGQRRSTETGHHLHQDVGHDLALVEIPEQRQGDGHGRIEVRAAHTAANIDAHGHGKTPDDADLPLAKAGPRQLERPYAADAAQQENEGAQKF